VSARVLVDVIRRAGRPERKLVIDVARSHTAYDTGGFTNPARPVDISPGHEHPRDMILVRSEGGAWKQETGWLTPRKFGREPRHHAGGGGQRRDRKSAVQGKGVEG